MKKTARQIFIFSVGINRYASEDIHNLSGCVNDVNVLQEVLKAHLNIPDGHCKCLLDEKATRENIIEGFRAHFSRLKEGDIAIFHYSGHGSWEWTTPEFQGPPFETPGNKNEMILSHDFAMDGVLGIADKELRWLISEIQYPKEGAHKPVHFVGLMDCCFSGSMFRRVDDTGAQMDRVGVQIRRSAPDDPTARQLSQYLEGQYLEMQQSDGQITLPQADYILLSASSHNEPANEDENGGVFTQALLKVLGYAKEGGKYPTYAALHFLISSSIQRETDYQQQPYLEYSGRVNPFECFAMNGGAHYSLLPEIRIEKGSNEGVVNLGALHGVELQRWRHAELPVYQKADTLVRVGSAKLRQVQVEQSIVTFLPNDKFDEAHDKALLVGIHAKPLRINFIVPEAEEREVAVSLQDILLEKIDEKGLGGLFQESKEGEYSIVFHSDKITIYHSGTLITALRAPFQPADFDFIIDVLHKIARWEQINTLENPKDSEVDLEKVVFNFSYRDYKGVEKTYEVAPVGANEKGVSKICIPFDEEEEDGGAILYEIKVGHNQIMGHMELYFYLVHLDRKYSISQKFETLKSLMPLMHDSKNSYEYISENHNLGLGIVDENVNETHDVFILIVSAEPLTAPYLFEQKGLGEAFGKVLSADARKALVKRDVVMYKKERALPALWAVKKLHITLTKK